MIKDKLAPSDPSKNQYLVPWELTVTQDKLFIETIDLEAGSTRPNELLSCRQSSNSYRATGRVGGGRVINTIHRLAGPTDLDRPGWLRTRPPQHFLHGRSESFFLGEAKGNLEFRTGFEPLRLRRSLAVSKHLLSFVAHQRPRAHWTIRMLCTS